MTSIKSFTLSGSKIILKKLPANLPEITFVENLPVNEQQKRVSIVIFATYPFYHEDRIFDCLPAICLERYYWPSILKE